MPLVRAPPETLALHVLVLIAPGCPYNAERYHLGDAAGRRQLLRRQRTKKKSTAFGGYDFGCSPGQAIVLKT
jgi:hypothetical protein